LNVSHPIWTEIDWSRLALLRLQARQVAEGVYAGRHRSARRGAGVEFGGYREYAPGDDLRWLDRRSLLRHDRLVIRQFETETDRALCLLVDASASMGFRGSNAAGSKLDYAAVLAAALARLALWGGDPASVSFFGGGPAAPVALSSGRDQFERIVAALAAARPGGDAYQDGAMLERALQNLSRATKRGAIVVVLSDLIDLPPTAADRISALAHGGRVLTVVQTLDLAEATFPFVGALRLRAMEGGAVVETDAETTRDEYLAALAERTREWNDAVVARGGRFVRAVGTDDPVRIVRSIVHGLR
jgi:uncharacterized protein (DUF58 family)